MPNAYISGTGFYVPPRVVKNEDLRTQYGIDTTHDWILQRTGIEERRYAEEGVGSADLAVPAAQMAVKNAGLTMQDLDLIVFATLSPDHCFPGSGVYLQEKLGLCNGDDAKFVGALDVRNQCSGFIYGLGTASSMVKAGAAKHVLVVGAETHSAALDLTTRGRNVSSLFGDGAGAVIVSATEENRGVRSFRLGADGRFADVLSQKVWDIKKRPFIPQNADGIGQVAPEMMWAQMDGKLVFKNAVERMMRALMEVCVAEGITGQEGAICREIQTALREVGVPTTAMTIDEANTRIPLPTQVGNLIVKLPGTRPGASPVLFMTHMDTVPLCAGAKPLRSAARITNAANTALGGDNRTGCAVLVTLAAELLRQKLPHPPFCRVEIAIGEQTGGFGNRPRQCLEPRQTALGIGRLRRLAGCIQQVAQGDPTRGQGVVELHGLSISIDGSGEVSQGFMAMPPLLINAAESWVLGRESIQRGERGRVLAALHQMLDGIEIAHASTGGG